MAKTYFNVNSIPQNTYTDRLAAPYLYDYDSGEKVYLEVEAGGRGYADAEPYGLVAYGYDNFNDVNALYRPSESVIQDIIKDIGFVHIDDHYDYCTLWFDYAYSDDEWLRDTIIDDVDGYMTDYYISSWISEVDIRDWADGNYWYIPLCRSCDDNINDTDFPNLYATHMLSYGDGSLSLPAGDMSLCKSSPVDWESNPNAWNRFLLQANYKNYNGQIIDVPLLCLHQNWGGSTSTSIRYLAEITATSEGKIKCAGIIEPSDITLKNKLSEIDVDFSALKSISKAYYTYKDDDEQKQHIGVIAQEVQKYYPEIVTKVSAGYLTVDYSKLAVIALKAIDKLDDRLKAIEAKLGI
jgi:hypothetical protein